MGGGGAPLHGHDGLDSPDAPAATNARGRTINSPRAFSFFTKQLKPTKQRTLFKNHRRQFRGQLFHLIKFSTRF